MEFAYLKQQEKRKKADVLIIPFWKQKEAVSLSSTLSELVKSVLEIKDFRGKEGEVVYLYAQGYPEKRIALLGLGAEESVTVETLRRSYGSFTKSCAGKQISSVNLLLPQQKKLSDEDLIRGISEGILLPNYTFLRYKHKDPEDPKINLLEKITWIGPQSRVLPMVEKSYIISQGVDYARDLVNGNADEITPEYLAECARDIAKKDRAITTTILNKKRLEKEKLGLLLSVNRGSSREPVLIIMEYRGNPTSKDHTILVGKGITYDTGGLNLKPTGSMETMKCDMGGAAACFGAMLGVSQLQLPVNFTVVIPSTENCIDANSFKPGDVYTSYSGKTVEVTNTDAEGRLVLADGLSYALKNLSPTRMIDIATLTGAIEVALGSEASGLMSTNDDLAEQLLQAGANTYERLWRMPLYAEYKDRLSSDIADLKSWNGRSAGANVAATFLKQFVGDIPWAHIDIAGTAYTTDTKKYLTKYASGFGVRLLIEFLEGIGLMK